MVLWHKGHNHAADSAALVSVNYRRHGHFCVPAGLLSLFSLLCAAARCMHQWICFSRALILSSQGAAPPLSKYTSLVEIRPSLMTSCSPPADRYHANTALQPRVLRFCVVDRNHGWDLPQLGERSARDNPERRAAGLLHRVERERRAENPQLRVSEGRSRLCRWLLFV